MTVTVGTTAGAVDATFAGMVERNLDHFFRVVNRADEKMESLDLHRDNLFRALEFGSRLPNTSKQSVFLLSHCLSWVIERCNYPRWSRLIIRVVNGHSGEDQAQLVLLVNRLGFLQMESGDMGRAEKSLDSAQRIAFRLENPASVAITQYFQAVLHLHRNQLKKGQEQLDYALLLFQKEVDLTKNENAKIYGFALNLAGHFAFQRGHQEVAESKYRESQTVLANVTPAYHATLPDASLINFHALLGNVDQAEFLAERTLASVTKFGLQSRADNILIALATAYGKAKQWDDALTTVFRVDQVELQKRGRIRTLARTKANVGYYMIWLDRTNEALLYLRESLKLWCELGDVVEQANVIGCMGYIELKNGSHSLAAKKFQQALDILLPLEKTNRVAELREEFEDELHRLTS